MADGLFEGTLGGYRDSRGPWGGYESFDKLMRSNGPQELTKSYENVAKYGVYGQGGVQSIMDRIRQSRSFQRRSLARGLRRSFGTRLGPRSGAVDTMVTNRVYAPAMQQDAETEAGLISQNLGSRMQGLEGIQRIMEFLQGRYDAAESRDSSGGGFMDFVGPVADIAGAIPGIGTALGLGKKAAEKVWS